jgi:hypothetical protein
MGNKYFDDAELRAHVLPKIMPVVPPYMRVDEFKEHFLKPYAEWINTVTTLAPDYNRWADTNNKPLWTPEVSRYLEFPKSIDEAVKTVPEYLKNLPERWKLRSKDMPQATVVVVISVVLWLFGLLFGSLWLPRPIFITIVPPAAAMKAAAARRAEAAKQAAAAMGTPPAEGQPQNGEKKE